MSYNQGGYGGGGGGYSQGGYNQGYSQNNYNQSGYSQGERFEPRRNQGPASPYASGYGQTPSNPFAQPAPNRYEGGDYGNGGYAQQNGDSVEMTQVNGFRNQDSVRDRANQVFRAAKTMEDTTVAKELFQIQENYLSSPNPKLLREQLTKKQTEIDLAIIRFQDELKKIVESGQVTDQDRPQIALAMNQVKSLSQKNRESDDSFRAKQRANIKRQVKLSSPNATAAEIEAEVEDVQQRDGEVFAERLLSADRRGQVATILGNVQDRHQAIQNIETQMVKLAELFEQMNTMVQTQEPQVEQIERSAQDTENQMGQAIVQLDQATEKAKAARRKKWICLGIGIAILLVIVIIIIIVVEVEKH